MARFRSTDPKGLITTGESTKTARLRFMDRLAFACMGPQPRTEPRPTPPSAPSSTPTQSWAKQHFPLNPFRVNAAFVLPLFIVLWGGCGGRDLSQAPAGFGVVREHVIFDPHNVPPISSKLDFTIFEIDGAPVKREIPPPFVDMQPGALVSAGTHRFKARVAPIIRPRDYQPYEVTFEAKLESGKVYYLVDQNGDPVLIELHLDSR
jgi:hypothetical protein